MHILSEPVTLITQHQKRMRLIVLSSLACLDFKYFFLHNFINGAILGINVIEHKMYVLILLTAVK